MNIAKIETFHVECPLDEPFGWSMDWTEKRQCLITRITTDEGIVGWGEGGRALSASVIHELFGPVLLGEDPLNINRLWHRMFHRLHNENCAGGFGGDALSAIDIALWDIAGKASGKSVSEMLGGSLRDRVAVYATGLYYRKDDFPEKLIEEALSYKDAGYKGMKMKIGGQSVREDFRRALALREAIGSELYLMVDANKAYNASVAIEMGLRLAELDIAWFEEPVLANDVEGYLAVKSGQSIPVAGGEVLRGRSENRDLLSRRAVDIVQPDISQVGGISEMRTVATMANAMGIQTNPHVWGSPIMIAASIHSTSTFAACPYAHEPRPFEQEPVMEFDQTPNPIRNDLGTFSFEQKDGYVDIPIGPGLGVDVDEVALERLCIESRATNI
ncbi:MAG: hypothetical protein CBD18_01510 [Opitutales bacterium TMED158]|nr:MAG: hypothetical protein CBD18_01510 [Opitutales bacterium TMED158]